MLNSNTMQNKDVHREANQLFAKSLLLVCVFLMVISAVARIFGILWFQADLSVIEEPNHLIQQIIFAVLKGFELLFTYKILCKIDWGWCALISCLHVAVVGFFSGFVANLLDLLLMILLPIAFNHANWKISLRDNIIFYVIVLAYSATFMFGRVGSVFNATTNFYIGILSAIDYKVLFVALYLVVKTYGGIKLWKNQQKPFFKTKDQST